MTASDWLPGGGYVLIVLGLGCFPFGSGASPKRDLDAFNNLADVGLFWKAGVGLVGMGVLCLIASNISWGRSRSRRHDVI